MTNSLTGLGLTATSSCITGVADILRNPKVAADCADKKKCMMDVLRNLVILTTYFSRLRKPCQEMHHPHCCCIQPHRTIPNS